MKIFNRLATVGKRRELLSVVQRDSFARKYVDKHLIAGVINAKRYVTKDLVNPVKKYLLE